MRINKNVLVAKVKANLKQSKNEDKIEKILSDKDEKEAIDYIKKIQRLDYKKGLPILEAVANYEKSTPKILKQLAESDQGEVRWAILKHKNLTKDIIKDLAEFGDYKFEDKISIYDKIATLKETPREALLILAKDKDCWHGRAIDIMNNKNVTEDIIKILSNNDDYLVRIEVAKHKKTPMSILKDLAEDKDKSVRMEVWENDKVPDDMAKQIADTLPPSWTGSGY